MNEQDRADQRTTSWDRTQVETDDRTHDEVPQSDPTVPKWNKASMGEEREDHTRTPRATENELADSGGPLSGGGENPGGGERWADRDQA